MASGWVNDGAVQEQIDSTIEDAIVCARSQLPRDRNLIHCEKYDVATPEARRWVIPSVRLCINRQTECDREQAEFSGCNRHDSKDSQLC